ncbi:hypothetical protein GEV27_02055 [Aeromicrobium sp. S22]|uniref:type VII secretion target n=1 Tax=Aeromicrobium sp. S22 TaxID=2662029 RepID=UPI00129D4FE5|nr:type VII secretion target [Aeromicrobium sp. S22]MRK00296.1 hypothetical protein [Aeromicrobium sp. S22]
MAGGFEVWIETLRTSATEWDDQAEELRTARRSLNGGSSSVADLGSRVSPAAEAFFEAWITDLSGRVENASSHSTALTDAATTYQVRDNAQTARLANLLRWSDRGLTPEG